jgi:hypothetical protein
MLPPKQANSLPIAQLSALNDSLSQIIRNELIPLKVLIECSAKDIDVRLLKLEDRLQTALEPHSLLKAQTTYTEDNTTKFSINGDKDSNEIAGKGMVID